MAATLRTSSGAPLAGKSVTFTVTAPGGGTRTLVATTNATGRASTNSYTPLLPGNHTVRGLVRWFGRARRVEHDRPGAGDCAARR